MVQRIPLDGELEPIERASRDELQALQLSQQVLPALDLQHAEIATGDIQHRQAEQTPIAQHRRNQVIATLVAARIGCNR